MDNAAENATLSDAAAWARWREFIELTEHVLGSQWVRMLYGLAPDVTFESQVFAGFRCAPAAKGYHHAYLGGLVAHYLEMWYFWDKLRASVDRDLLLTDRNVLQGIIMHDLHKGWTTYVYDKEIESGFNYGKHPSSSMLTDDQKSVYILTKAGIVPDLLMLNVLFNSEGGWAKSPPRWSSTLAKMVYILDELSGNVRARGIAGNVLDVRTEMAYSTLFEVQL